jgi:hypothetical protein
LPKASLSPEDLHKLKAIVRTHVKGRLRLKS